MSSRSAIVVDKFYTLSDVDDFGQILLCQFRQMVENCGIILYHHQI